MYPHGLADVLEEHINLKLRMLPRRYLEEMGHASPKLLEGKYFKTATRSKITSNHIQKVRDYVHTFIFPQEYTLRAESIAESDSHCSTSSEWLDDSEDEDEVPRKVVLENNHSVSLKFCLVATNIVCHQMLF